MPNRIRKKSIGSKLAWTGLGVLGSYAAWKISRRIEIEWRNQHLRRGRTIVILGAGFAGRHVALELARQLPNPQDGRIILIDQQDFLLFTPMLTEAAGGELDPHHIVSPANRLPRRIEFIQGHIDAIDLKARSVSFTLGGGEIPDPRNQRTITADHLVLALGSVTNFHNIPGLREHSLTMKTLEDAAQLRHRVLRLLQRATEESDTAQRRAILTLVVGGAGYTGVETMAAINDLLRDRAKDYPQIHPDEIRTILVDPGDRLLPELNSNLGHFAQEQLERRGVELRLNAKITSADADHVELDGSERIPMQTLIWAGGVTPNPLIKSLDCQHGHHDAVVVDRSLAVPNFPGAWALGDSAQVPRPDSNKTYAPTAQNATREGRLVARNIAAVLRGKPTTPFNFQPLGELALVGRHAGVARIFGFQFAGFSAWALWRLIYLSKMPSPRQRVRILFDWTFDLLLGRNVVLTEPLAGAPKPESGVPATP